MHQACDHLGHGQAVAGNEARQVRRRGVQEMQGQPLTGLLQQLVGEGMQGPEVGQTQAAQIGQ
jgi:hypothetical protein